MDVTTGAKDKFRKVPSEKKRRLPFAISRRLFMQRWG